MTDENPNEGIDPFVAASSELSVSAAAGRINRAADAVEQAAGRLEDSSTVVTVEDQALPEIPPLPVTGLTVTLDINDLFANWNSVWGNIDEVLDFLERVRDVFDPREGE